MPLSGGLGQRRGYVPAAVGAEPTALARMVFGARKAQPPTEGAQGRSTIRERHVSAGAAPGLFDGGWRQSRMLLQCVGRAAPRRLRSDADSKFHLRRANRPYFLYSITTGTRASDAITVPLVERSRGAAPSRSTEWRCRMRHIICGLLRTGRRCRRCGRDHDPFPFYCLGVRGASFAPSARRDPPPNRLDGERARAGR